MLVIRPLTAATLAELVALDRASFPAPWSAEMWQHELEEAHLWGAWQGEDLLGVASFHIIYDEAELYKIMVHSGWRRLGIGAKLLSFSLSELKKAGVTHIFLEVAEKNGAARELYSHFSFVESGRRKNYYENPPDDAILMKLDL